jgi:putative transposase
MDGRWTYSSSCVYDLGYHIIWCVKYRRKILVEEVERRFKELLVEQSLKNGYVIESMEVMPDHVHLFIKCEPTDSPHKVVQQLKGVTSRMLRLEFPHVKSRVPTLWTRSYYCETVGHISEDRIHKYILDQKNK